MSYLSKRRRALIGMLGGEPDATFQGIRMLTKNVSGYANILGGRTGQSFTSYVDRMWIDGEEVTPVDSYQFEDSGVHSVDFTLVNATTIPANMFYYFSGNPISKLDFPSTVTTFAEGAIRSFGNGGSSDLVIRATQMPTFGANNFNFLNWGRPTQWVVLGIYVPQALVNDYKTMLTEITDPDMSAYIDCVHPIEGSQYE